MKWVTSNGKLVYWQDCNVTIFVKDSKGKKDKGTKCPESSREWQVLLGIDLYCFGGKLRII
jgi:hypothetical protein